jgi:CRISPR-associated protein Cmr5
MSAFFENNIEHERADYAYKCIKDILDNHNGIKDKYRSEVLQTAIRIYNAGLMQTLTFYCSKMPNDEHFRKLSLHLMKWILRDELTTNRETWTENIGQTWQLFNTILNHPNNLIVYTERTKTVVVWLKRFADGRIEKPRR